MSRSLLAQLCGVATLFGCNTSPSKGPPADAGTSPIVQTGDPVLRARAKEVAPAEISSPEMQALIRRMIDAMRAAPGVGLAAPQIGVSQRVIVLEDSPELAGRLTPEELRERERAPFPVRVLINPVLKKIGDDERVFFEGCLSVKGFTALVPRVAEVEVEALDEKGKAVTWRVRGWPARILQHEVDHLDGALYLDRMLSRSFSTNEKARERFAGKPIKEVRDILGL